MSCNEWNEYTIEELCNVIDSLHKSPKYVESGYPIIRVKDISQGFLRLENTAYVTKEVYEEFSKKHKPRKGDMLFSRVGTYGITTFVDKKVEFCLGQNTVVITDFKRNIINNRFMYYMMISNIVKEQIERLVTGSTQKTISMKSIKSIVIPTPSLEEQEKIANILSSLDDKIELNNEMNKTLEEMAQSIFKRWFVDFEFPNDEGEPYKSSGGEMVDSELGMIPKGWEVGTLDDIATVTMGVSPKSYSYNTENIGVPLLNGASDFNSTIIKPTKHTTEPKKMCKKGEMVFCIRATIGNLTFADRDYCIGRGVASVQPKLEEYRELIYFNINRSIEKLISQASGSVFSNLTRADINNMTVIIPTNEVLDIFSSNTSNIIEKVQSNNLENEELISIRENLLPKLMSRKLKIAY